MVAGVVSTGAGGAVVAVGSTAAGAAGAAGAVVAAALDAVGSAVIGAAAVVTVVVAAAASAVAVATVVTGAAALVTAALLAEHPAARTSAPVTTTPTRAVRSATIASRFVLGLPGSYRWSSPRWWRGAGILCIDADQGVFAPTPSVLDTSPKSAAHGLGAPLSRSLGRFDGGPPHAAATTSREYLTSCCACAGTGR